MNTELDTNTSEFLEENWEQPGNDGAIYNNTINDSDLYNNPQDEVQEEEEGETEDPAQSSNTNSSSFYSNLYDWFDETGLLPYSVDEFKQDFTDVNINTDEGFKQVIQNNIEYLAQQKIREDFAFLDDEQVNDFLNVLANGGSIHDFATLYEDIDWENINITKNISNQKKVIREDYIRQGKTEDYIDDMLEMLENSNKLEKAAHSAKESLTTTIKLNREYQRDMMQRQQEEEQMLMQKEANDFLNTLKTKSSIANIPINNEIKQQILDFRYQDYPLYVDNNQNQPYLDEYGNHIHMTPLDYALAIETPQQKATREMFSIYLILNNYNLEGVTRQIRTQEINSLEKKLKNVPRGVKSKTSNPTELDRMWNNPD